MKIVKVEAYPSNLTYRHGNYVMSGGRVHPSWPSTLVKISTDEGLCGWGEVCPNGATYLPSFVGSVREGIKLLAASVIGTDPTQIDAVNASMNRALLGFPDAKGALDIACWDLLGKTANLPVATLLGGIHQQSFPLYTPVPLAAPEEMTEFVQARRAEGIRAFQLKIGNEPREDAERIGTVLQTTDSTDTIVADANAGWSLQDAMIGSQLLESFPIYLESPCRTLLDCIAVAKHTTLPMVYDECIIDVDTMYRAVREGRAGAFNLKLSRLGGLSGTVRMRNLAVALGSTLTIEDTWGGDVVAASVCHVAASTPPEALFTTAFSNTWVNESVAIVAPKSERGRGFLPTGPGLGVEVDERSLGAPLFCIE